MPTPNPLPEADQIWALLRADGRIAVRVTPNAKAAAIAIGSGSGENRALHIRVTVPPEDGKANDAVIALLAQALHIRKSAIAIVQGHSSRIKLVQINE
jgi:uncharacterized protein